MPLFIIAKYQYGDGVGDEQLLANMFDDLQWDNGGYHVLMCCAGNEKVLRADGLQSGSFQVPYKNSTKTQGINWYIFNQATILYPGSTDRTILRASNHKAYGEVFSFFPLPGKPSPYPQFPGQYQDIKWDLAMQAASDDATYDHPGSYVLVCGEAGKLSITNSSDHPYVETYKPTIIKSLKGYEYGVWVFTEGVFEYSGNPSTDYIRFANTMQRDIKVEVLSSGNVVYTLKRVAT